MRREPSSPVQDEGFHTEILLLRWGQGLGSGGAGAEHGRPPPAALPAPQLPGYATLDTEGIEIKHERSPPSRCGFPRGRLGAPSPAGGPDVGSAPEAPTIAPLRQPRGTAGAGPGSARASPAGNSAAPRPEEPRSNLGTGGGRRPGGRYSPRPAEPRDPGRAAAPGLRPRVGSALLPSPVHRHPPPPPAPRSSARRTAPFPAAPLRSVPPPPAARGAAPGRAPPPLRPSAPAARRAGLGRAAPLAAALGSALLRRRAGRGEPERKGTGPPRPAPPPAARPVPRRPPRSSPPPPARRWPAGRATWTT